MQHIKIASWNILAAPWAAPKFYPKTLDRALLERSLRIAKVAERIVALDPTPDVWCLQEVTAPELSIIVDGLERANRCSYGVLHASNARDYWSNWLVDGVAWEANGPAVLVRNDCFEAVTFRELSLGGLGNAAVLAQATHLESGSALRIVSVHLDADAAPAREAELASLFAQLDDPQGDDSRRDSTATVLAGDFNCDTREGLVHEMIVTAGYVDLHTELGQFDPTHPYGRPGDAHVPLTRIDHVLVKDAGPVEAAIHDVGVWGIVDPVERLIAHLQLTGSDHLMISGCCAI